MPAGTRGLPRSGSRIRTTTTLGASIRPSRTPRRSRNPSRSRRPLAVISNAQRKRLWAVAKENTVPEELLRQLVLEVAGVDSTLEIPKDRYDALIEAVQAQAVPF